MHDPTRVRPVGGRPLVCAAVVLLLAGTACASPGSSRVEGLGAGADAAEAAEAPSRLHVHNRNWADMRIYAVREAERYRLLSVTSMRTDSTALPRSLLAGSGFRLVADPVGADAPYYSATIYPRRGETILWRLENHLEQSSLWVY